MFPPPTALELLAPPQAVILLSGFTGVKQQDREQGGLCFMTLGNLEGMWSLRKKISGSFPVKKKKKAMTLSDSRVWYLVNVSMSPWPSESFQGSFLPPCLLPPHFGKFLWEGAGSHPKNLGQAGLCRISLYHAAATSQIERQTLSRR